MAVTYEVLCDADEAGLFYVTDARPGIARLRNTRTVSRNCYVHPNIPDAYRTGDLQDAWKRARATPRFSRGERTVLTVLRDGQ